MRTLLLCGLLVTGCAEVPQVSSSPTTTVEIGAPAPAPSPKAQLLAFTAEDLQAADADAGVKGDAIAHACYPVLIKHLADLQPTPAPATVGAFLVFQRARDKAKGLKGGIPQDILQGCAPLLIDAQMDLNQFIARLGTLVGAGALTGGLVP